MAKSKSLLLLLFLTKGWLQIGSKSEDKISEEKIIENILNDESEEENFTDIEEKSEDYIRLKSFIKDQVTNGLKKKTLEIQSSIQEKFKIQNFNLKKNDSSNFDFSDDDTTDTIKEINSTPLRRKKLNPNLNPKNSNLILKTPKSNNEFIIFTKLNKRGFYKPKKEESFYIKKSNFYYEQLCKSQNDYINKNKNNNEKINLENGISFVYDKINFNIILTIESECFNNKNINYELCMKWSDFAFVWIHFGVFNVLKSEILFVSNFILHETLMFDDFIEIYDWLLDIGLLSKVFKEAKDSIEEYKKIFNIE